MEPMTDLGQRPADRYRNGEWRPYSPVDGLAGLQVDQIEQDHGAQISALQVRVPSSSWPILVPARSERARRSNDHGRPTA